MLGHPSLFENKSNIRDSKQLPLLRCNVAIAMGKPSRLEGTGDCFLLPKRALEKPIIHWLVWDWGDIILYVGYGDSASCCGHGGVTNHELYN